MGVVCCEAPPKLAHDDDVEAIGQGDPLGGTTASSAVALLPSDSHVNIGQNLTSKPAPSIDHDRETSYSEDTENNQDKKRVQISDEVTLIPLLTSSSFFRKTPKPATITSNSYGIMPSFRVVAPSAISESTTDLDSDLVAKSSLWWTKEERREIVQANQKTTREFKRFHPTKVREANLVYSDIVHDCSHRNECQQHTVESCDDDEDIYDFFQNQHLKRRTNSTSATCHPSTKKRKRSDFTPTVADDSRLPPVALPDATIDLPTNVRGLEWGVMPDAKRYRKAHAKTVLKWQDRFRKMNERRRTRFERKGHEESWDSTESSSSSSSSSDDETDSEGNFSNEFERTQRAQQDLLLGEKASISSLRSCMLARVFGKSDELAANPLTAKATELEEKRSSSWSPTPSLTGTESSSSDNDDEDVDESDDESESDESESESDMSDTEDEEDENVSSYQSLVYYRYSTNLQSTNANSQRRMFRPRMMPPTSWR